MMELLHLVEVASVVLSEHSAVPPAAGAAIAVGLAALGTGYAQSGIGAAAVGAVAEDSDNFALSLVFTVIPETLIIIAFVTIFVV
jgi:V/A-type H+-transporting ATPase subunit K